MPTELNVVLLNTLKACACSLRLIRSGLNLNVRPSVKSDSISGFNRTTLRPKVPI